MYRTVFGLCGRGREWDYLGEWHWNMYNIIYETSGQSRFDAWYWMLGAGALGRPKGMIWGGRREEGSGWGTHVYLWQIHFDIWQNQYNIVKLNKKKKWFKYKENVLNSDSQMTFTSIRIWTDFGQSLGHLEEACYHKPLFAELFLSFRIWPCELIIRLWFFLHLEFSDQSLASCPQSSIAPHN